MNSNRSRPGWDGEGLRALPDIAFEYSAVIMYNAGPGPVCFGDFDQNLATLPPVVVRLGTYIDFKIRASCVGFRIMMRNQFGKIEANGVFEECYIIVSYKFEPKVGSVSYTYATEEDKDELRSATPMTTSNFSPDGKSLLRVDFVGQNSFDVTSYHHPLGGRADTSNPYVASAAEMKFFNRAKKVSLFLPWDDILLKHLDTAIKNGCVGKPPPPWNKALNPSAVPTWPDNLQTKMVAGSSRLLNVLNVALYQEPLQDGPGTSVEDRPKAQKFKQFVRVTFPKLDQNSDEELPPIMLNVIDGKSIEIPFGAGTVNRRNTYAGINVLHKMLQAGFPASDIGIVTFYPGQAEYYQAALEMCHEHKPDVGYDRVKAMEIDDWIGQETEIAIVDLVRNATSHGNLGLLSQASRMQVALTLHKNGLIIIGDRRCTATSIGSVIVSKKLEKMFRWLEDYDCIQNVRGEQKVRSSLGTDQREAPRDSSQVAIDEESESTTQPRRVASIAELESGQTQLAAETRTHPALRGIIDATETLAIADEDEPASAGVASDRSITRVVEHQQPQSQSINSQDVIGPLNNASNRDTRATQQDIQQLPRFLPRQATMFPSPRDYASRITNENSNPGFHRPRTTLPSFIPLGIHARSGATVPRPSSPRDTISSARSAPNNAIVLPGAAQPSRLRNRYQTLRVFFDSLHIDDAQQVFPDEDRLFRRLGEACMIGDVVAFEGIYTELMLVAAGLGLRER